MPQHDPVPGASHAPATAVERSQGTDPNASYERRDANIKVILWLTFGVAATSAFVFWGSLALRDHFESIAKSNDPELSPLADVEQKPPAPRLQDNSFQDLVEFRASQEHMLNSYAWIDREKDQVQIPVSRAMDLILERGLPTPKGPTQPQQGEGGQQEQKSAPQAQPENGQNNDQSAPPPAENTPDQPPSDRPMPENR